MSEEKAFDWIGLIIIVFFLLFSFANTFFSKKKAKPPLPRKVPERESAPSKKVHISPPPIVRQPPKVLPSIKTEKRRKKTLGRYGSLKNGIILSQILKRPYID